MSCIIELFVVAFVARFKLFPSIIDFYEIFPASVLLFSSVSRCTVDVGLQYHRYAHISIGWVNEIMHFDLCNLLVAPFTRM